MTASTDVLDRIRTSVDPGSGFVPSFVHSSPDVYDLELERIFQRGWLFVAHESELRSPGDYVTRDMGGEPVIVTRDEAGDLRVHLNVCRHRGARLCRSDSGNTSHFRCPYHSFTYANDGVLRGVPFQREVFGDDFDKDSMPLIQARVATYRGLIWATWQRDGPSLEEYLGDMTWYLDILVGRAEMEVTGPPHKWELPMAWKLGAENFMSDAYHTASAHGSIAKLRMVANIGFGKDGYHIYTGNGHGLGVGTQDQGSVFRDELQPEYEANLSAEQLKLLGQIKNMHGNIFPSFGFVLPTPMHYRGEVVVFGTFRVWQPKGPDCMEIHSWGLVEKRAPQWWKDLARQAYAHTFGPSGLLEQDDAEILSGVTRATKSRVAELQQSGFNYEMGMGRTPAADFVGPGRAYAGKFNEESSRQFYVHWRERMLEGSEGDRA